MSGGSSRPPNADGIRKYLSPPTTPVQPRVRNRRIIESDSSEDPPPAQRPRSDPPQLAQLPPVAEAPAAEARPASPILIPSESDDSMYVPVRWERPANAQTGTTPQRHAAASSTRATSQRRTATSRQRELAARICDCEAEEVPDEASSSAPDESDGNAAELYRAAMLGVRNRPNAMRQLRSDSVPCATCAKFMAFLRCFL